MCNAFLGEMEESQAIGYSSIESFSVVEDRGCAGRKEERVGESVKEED
jgi:hypothetical protein